MKILKISFRSDKLSVSDKRRRRLKAEADAEIEAQIINTKVLAELHEIKVVIGTTKGIISDVSVGGLNADVVMRQKAMTATVGLKILAIDDPTEGAEYPKVSSIMID